MFALLLRLIGAALFALMAFSSAYADTLIVNDNESLKVAILAIEKPDPSKAYSTVALDEAYYDSRSPAEQKVLQRFFNVLTQSKIRIVYRMGGLKNETTPLLGVLIRSAVTTPCVGFLAVTIPNEHVLGSGNGTIAICRSNTDQDKDHFDILNRVRVAEQDFLHYLMIAPETDYSAI